VGAPVAEVTVADVEDAVPVGLAADVVADDGEAFSSLLSHAGTNVLSATAAATLTMAIVGFFIRTPDLLLSTFCC
jgi:hypothetical protein